MRPNNYFNQSLGMADTDFAKLRKGNRFICAEELSPKKTSGFHP